MTLQQLHYVLVIAEAGSLNRAAEQLYLSQPSLTSAVRELEKELGIVLFNRSGRGVTPTQDGAEFLLYARQLYHQYESLMDKYSGGKNIKRKFGVSTQHYSFAVKAFVELVKRFDTSQYEFAIRETKTRDVISDVATLKSEIGILYLSDFNRAVLMKLLRANRLEFHHADRLPRLRLPLGGASAGEGRGLRHVWTNCANIPAFPSSRAMHSSFYFAEEILSTNEYTAHHQGQRPRHDAEPDDRPERLHPLFRHHLRGAQRRRLCRGALLRQRCRAPAASSMDIGYIVRQDMLISDIGKQYICELQTYLRHAARSGK